jgi:rhodanese-related sulfurtransferase
LDSAHFLQAYSGHIVDFFLEQTNILLVVVAVTAVVALALPSFLKGGAKSVNVQQAVQLANHKQAIFVDIRNHDAFKAGSIPQARNIPIADLANKLNSLAKDKPIIVFCEHGRDSVRVGADLRKKGYAEAVTLDGGLRNWLKEGMPISKKS